MQTDLVYCLAFASPVCLRIFKKEITDGWEVRPIWLPLGRIPHESASSCLKDQTCLAYLGSTLGRAGSRYKFFP